MGEHTDYGVPAGVAWTRDVDEAGAPRIFVAQLPNGPVAVLPDNSALIWLTAVEGSGAVVEAVAAVNSHDVEEIRDDVDSLLDDLVVRGLLERR